MKASDLLNEPKRASSVMRRLCRDFEAIRYLGSEVVFKACRDAGWLRAVVEQHKLTLFDYSDLDECVDRIKAEGLPQSSMSGSAGEK